jgi:hypothetical protein
MDKGQIVRRGKPDEVADEYLEFQGVPPTKKSNASDETADEDDDMSMIDDSLNSGDF